MHEDKNRDEIDELLQAKLYDFEADVEPALWDSISEKLPACKKVSMHRRAKYWWAAAAIVGITATSSLFFMMNHKHDEIPVAQSPQINQTKEIIQSEKSEQIIVAEEKVIPNKKPNISYIAAVDSRTMKKEIAKIEAHLEDENSDLSHENIPVQSNAKENPETKATPEVNINEEQTVRPLISNKQGKKITSSKKDKASRWTFGTGAGSYTTSTSNSINSYAFKNTTLNNLNLFTSNAPYVASETPKTNIRHKMPFSWGMGIGYALNDRWAIQSGINYSYMKSSWETNGKYNSISKQRLHFIGIPLGINYKIAEWNRLRFYASGGAQTEINVGGTLSTTTSVGDEKLGEDKQHIRMKELLWSVNAGVGASYPLWKFINAYVETGVNYYFDNGSTIETIRSEKPFNVNLQVGLRLGF